MDSQVKPTLSIIYDEIWWTLIRNTEEKSYHNKKKEISTEKYNLNF